MKNLKIIEKALAGFTVEQMDSVKIIVVPLDAADYFKSFKALPDGLEFEDEVFAKTGFNSDKMVAYFRNDRKLAYKI